MFSLLQFVYSNLNARRDRGEEDYKMEGKSKDEVDAMGDDSPHFRRVIQYLSMRIIADEQWRLDL